VSDVATVPAAARDEADTAHTVGATSWGCAVSGGVRKTCVIPELTGKEFAAVIRLPAPRRYEYFVKKVADRDTMWGLCDGDGWMTSADDSSNAEDRVERRSQPARWEAQGKVARLLT
jgi:hypothetical protein